MAGQTKTDNAPTPCNVCSRTLRGKQGLIQHSIATGHHAGRYCHECSRTFVSPTALADHKSSSIHDGSSKVVAVAVAAAAPAPSRTPKAQSPANNGIKCRDNTYTRLSRSDQSSIHKVLLSKCHPLHCLLTEGHRLWPDIAPAGQSDGRSTLVPTPPPSPKRRKAAAAAVVLDCEMAGTVPRNKSEAISLCAIDLLTGEVLMRTLIEPRRRVINWRTPITPITSAAMRSAAARGQALRGSDAARAALFEHIDANTVLIGQSVKFDLAALGVVHWRIVDSAILAAEAVFGGDGTKRFPRMWGLETLCRELLGLEIRRPVTGGGGGNGSSSNGGDATTHDSLEDTLATREVVLWCLRHPAELGAWGLHTRAAFYSKESKGKGDGKEKAKKKMSGRTRQGGRTRERNEMAGRCRRYSSSSTSEYLEWDDVVDWELWPKSPPSD